MILCIFQDIHPFHPNCQKYISTVIFKFCNVTAYFIPDINDLDLLLYLFSLFWDQFCQKFVNLINFFKELALPFIDFSLLIFHIQFLKLLFPSLCLLWIYFTFLFLGSRGGKLDGAFSSSLIYASVPQVSISALLWLYPQTLICCILFIFSPIYFFKFPLRIFLAHGLCRNVVFISKYLESFSCLLLISTLISAW